MFASCLRRSRAQAPPSGWRSTRRARNCAATSLAARAAARRSSSTPTASTGCCGPLYAEAGGAERPVAVIALGGYGRRHLCLHSDIDLLLLFDGRIGPAEEQFLRAFLHPLWDVGVVVGHQVRELDEFADLETDNPEFLLALLDARLVAGSAMLFDRLGAMFHTARRRTPTFFSRCSRSSRSGMPGSTRRCINSSPT